MTKNWKFWLVVFSLIFLLSLDYWSWDQDVTLTIFNFPSWIIYFVFLQFLLAALIYIFSTKYWK